VKVLDFALILGKLKKIKRTGWIKFKIPNPESVAEHSFRLAVMAMFLAPKVGANTEKSVKMALIHDLGEAEIGDVVTTRGARVIVDIAKKIENERKGLFKILNLIEEQETLSLFDELIENKTKEAKLVSQLDELEVALQAYEYEKEHEVDLSEFFENNRNIITNKYLKAILSDLEKLKNSS
jgi:putative hydrolases of HD superfamily